MGENEMNSLANAVDNYFDDEHEDQQQQEGLFAEQDLTEAAQAVLRTKRPKKVQFALVAIIKAPGGKNCVVEVCSCNKVRGEFVEELMQIGLSSKYFKDRLRAVVGNPSGELQSELEEVLKMRGEES
jgi:hypothetical protein